LVLTGFWDVFEAEAILAKITPHRRHSWVLAGFSNSHFGQVFLVIMGQAAPDCFGALHVVVLLVASASRGTFCRMRLPHRGRFHRIVVVFEQSVRTSLGASGGIGFWFMPLFGT